jgi:hypothetical protein
MIAAVGADSRPIRHLQNGFKSMSTPVATSAVTPSTSMFSQAQRRTSSPTHS